VDPGLADPVDGADSLVSTVIGCRLSIKFLLGGQLQTAIREQTSMACT
jgi:hypothetical protein